MLIPVSRLEPGFQRRLVVRAVAGDLARGEVHLAVRSGMDAAQIQHQHAVHEQPEIVVAGEFEHDVVAPIVLTAGRLREVGFQLHAEMEVDAALLPGGVRDAVEFLPVSGIHGVQGVAVNVVQVGLIFADIGRIQIVVGIELSVPQRFGSVLTFVHGAQLIVYLEGPAIQIGIVLGAVELVISTLVIGLLNEEMVDLIGTAEQLTQRFASFGLMGKLLNSCADLETSALEDVSTLKKILGEDSLRGEAKGKDAISFKSYAKLIFSTNELPLVINEKTNGFFRRLLILSMDRQPDHKRADYLDLLQNRMLRCDSDTVEAWIADRCIREAGARSDRGALFQSYDSYCLTADRTPLSRNNFYRSLRQKNFRDVMSCGYRYFEGLKLL